MGQSGRDGAGLRGEIVPGLSEREVAALVEASHLAHPAAYAARMSRGSFKVFRHTDHVSRMYADRVLGGGARTFVSAPPQTGKSTLIAEWGPQWLFDQFPERRIGIVAYNEELAVRSVRRIGDRIRADEPRLNVKLGKVTEDFIESTAGGYIRGVGLTGGITGWGFTDIVIDDPYKGPEDAFSPTARAKVEEAFWSVLMTRLAEGGNVFGIMTRWCDEDIFGTLIRKGGWEWVRLPAFAAADGDPLGRAPGEPLCPELHSAAKWEELRAGMPPSQWAALYDGAPLKAGAGMFSRAWLRILDAVPELYAARVRYWDMAASKTRKTRTRHTERDFASGCLMMRDREGRYVIEDVARRRGTAAEVEELVVRCAVADGPGVPIVVEKEPGSAGEFFQSYLARRLAGWAVTFRPSTGSKDTRAKPLAAQCEAGNVSILRASWNGDFLDECESFMAGGLHDDQVDSASGAFAELCAGRAWPFAGRGSEGSVGRAGAPRAVARRSRGFGDELSAGGLGDTAADLAGKDWL